MAHITAQRAISRVARCRVICTKVVVTEDMVLSFRAAWDVEGWGGRDCTPTPFLCAWSVRSYAARDLNRRSRRLLLTTNTDENAIAAPASIGLSSPAAARGRAATL